MSKFAGLVAVLILAVADATLYQVGSSRTYKSLLNIQNQVTLRGGDVVEVDYGTYTTSSTLNLPDAGDPGNPVTIRGIKNALGNRPILSGGTNTIEFSSNNYVFESFEVTGGSSRCIYHHADSITISDCVVHDCPAQGILGADCGSGSLTLQYTEVYHCGAGDTTHDHQIYMATDESAYPNAVFRMQFCYLHDGQGGNGVKSRARRNEIYYNWIEGSFAKALELIGPDLTSASDNGCPYTDDLEREDSDVVGNLLWATQGNPVTRLGGDGTGQSFGRYRFASNTFVSTRAVGENSAAFWLFQAVQSVQMHNNIFYDINNQPSIILRMVDGEFSWTDGQQIAGSNNWVPSGAFWARQGSGPTNVDFTTSTWTGTVFGTGKNPGFKSTVSPYDFSLTVNSSCNDAGVNPPANLPAGFQFIMPLPWPADYPPWRHLFNFSFPRFDVGGPAIGAYTDSAAGTSDDGGNGPSSGASVVNPACVFMAIIVGLSLLC